MTEQSGDEPITRLSRALSEATIQRINGMLLEGLFFYKRDDEDLFDQLRSRKTDFKQFWERYMGSDLVVDEYVAFRRSNRDTTEPYSEFLNPATPKDGRLYFQWHGQGARDRVIVFLHFLQFYETVLRRQDDAGYNERTFLYHEFVAWLQDRLRDAFATHEDSAPAPGQLHAAVKDVFRDLARFRFIEWRQERELHDGERERLPASYQEEKILLYSAMPGLLAYDPATLTQSLIEQAYGIATLSIDAPLEEEPE